MLIEEIKAIIETYPNFPREGIMFKDLNPILREPNLFLELINKMSEDIFLREADCIIGIDARGFIFASCIALKISKPLVLARKPGKLPGKLIGKSYDLEYGSNTLCIQKKSIRPYKSFAIVDDLLATGGTVNSIVDILNYEKKLITGLSVVVELNALKARSKFNFNISSLVNY